MPLPVILLASRATLRRRLRVAGLAASALALAALLGACAWLTPVPDVPDDASGSVGLQALGTNVLADFEPDAPAGFFTYNGASSVATSTRSVLDTDPDALPGQVGDNGILDTTFTINDYGGFGQDVTALGGPQDWSDYDAIGLWFHGTGSGLVYQFEIADNRSDPSYDSAERFDILFTDDTAGWTYLTFPFAAFTRATDFQPGGAPDDGFGLTEIHSWAIVLPLGTDTILIDDVALLGDGETTLRVGVATPTVNVVEGDTADVTVALTTPAPGPVAVDFATADGSAVAGTDYEARTGTLTFDVGESERTISIATYGNDIEDGARSFSLVLSNPSGADLGAAASATVNIADDDSTAPADLIVIDDFEAGLPSGVDGSGVAIGFQTFADPSSSVATSTTEAPPASVPGGATANTVLELDLNVNAYAGFVHAFENPGVDTWVPQDWSAYEGFGFWFFGLGSGTTVFVDVLDNRNPGSTSDDAERWTFDFVDDVPGWRFVKRPFTAFARKEIGNGAPNDGFGLTEIHGWALGTLNTGGPATYYVDDAGLYGTAPVRPLTVSFARAETTAVEGDTAEVVVQLSRALGLADDDPGSVSVTVTSEPGTAEPDRDYVPASRTLVFTEGGDTEQTVDVATYDNDKRDYDRTVLLRLEDVEGSDVGLFGQSVVAILDDEVLDPNLIDDMENGVYLWDAEPGATLDGRVLRSGDPDAVPGQGRYESVLSADLPIVATFEVQGKPCGPGQGVVPVVISDSPGLDVSDVDVDSLRFGGAAEVHRTRSGEARPHVSDGELTLHVAAEDLEAACERGDLTLTGQTNDGTPIAGSASGVERDFAIGRDWTGSTGMSFWFQGTGDGAPVTVTLQDNRAPDPGPSGWNLVWSDEFDAAAGTPPDPSTWSFEIGDGSVNRIPGWGNDELEYYTDDPENAAHDGNGNLVITPREADGDLACYYGPCAYTSARLISQHKAEFAYGRIESRIRVPGGAGLWPAFWSLGTDIAEVDWPQTGEIDFMEFVGRLPDEIFGTIHGPGYSGGQSFGNVYDFGSPVPGAFHTYAVEWEPDRIRWLVDGIEYHSATPGDVAPNAWVFNDPVFLLLNVAIGGNFGGPVGDDTVFPQDMVVDYVRVYQGPDTAERFEAEFVDDVPGWRQVYVPFADFQRSDVQPSGAPDDGLTLDAVWGYGLRASGPILLDEVRLE